MQQPDNRDQSEPEVNSQTEENSQSDITEHRKQENNQLEHTEKEADALVSHSKSLKFIIYIMRGTNIHISELQFPEISALIGLRAHS